MSAQKCLREGCSRKVDSTKRGEVFCYQHRNNAADATGAAKAQQLSDVGPTPPRRERVEHSDPEFGGVPETAEATDEPLEGVVIDSPEGRAAALRAERQERAAIEKMVDELRMLHPLMQAYETTKERYDALKVALRELLPAQTHTINGVTFVINEKDVFDAKLATAAASPEDADGNKKKPLITKTELEAISVMTPNAAKAGAHFKNRPEVLAALKKPQRSLSVKSVDQAGAVKEADAA